MITKDIKVGNVIIANVEILKNKEDKDADIYIHNICKAYLKFKVEYRNDKNELKFFHANIEEDNTHIEENVIIGITGNIIFHEDDYDLTNNNIKY